MSTASEPSTAPVDPAATDKPPLYRRPLVLIIAGAVVALLIIGGITTAALLGAKPATAHLAAASTSTPKAPRPTRSASPTPTPTPTPTATATTAAPQAGAAKPAAPAAPAAPPAAPVTPPIGTAPSYGVTIGTFTAVTAAGEHCPLTATASDYFDVVITWSTTHGNLQVIKDTNNNINPGGPAYSEVGPSGSRTVKQYCLTAGGIDYYSLTVSTTQAGANPSTLTDEVEVLSHFSN